MPSIVFKTFSGSTPRLADHLVNINAAAGEALDCRFDHGTLQSFRETKLVKALASTSRTVNQVGCCFFESEKCVDIATGTTGCQEVFRTGESNYPEIGIINYDSCTVNWHRLGVPCPSTTPSIVINSQSDESKNKEGRSYVFQYVNSLGQRGAASSPCDVAMIDDGASVTVSGWESQDASWDIATVRLYRTVSGIQGITESANVFDTTYMMVAEFPVSQSAYIDTKYNEELTDALQEDIVNPPPENLSGIIRIGGTNILVGYVGNKLYFSKKNMWWAWNYYYSLDDNIRGIAEANGIVYVGTDGHPYAVQGDADCDSAECRQIVRMPDAYPMANCGNRYICSTPMGAAYVGRVGLIGLAGHNAAVILTDGIYANDDWAKLIPESLTPVYYDAKIFVFGAVQSFYMALGTGERKGWALDSHCRLSDVAKHAFTSRDGILYIVKAGELVRWDSGENLRPHFWRSSTILTDSLLAFSCARMRVHGGEERVKLIGNRREIVDRTVLMDLNFRLPRKGLSDAFHLELSGTGTVSFVALATSMRELST